MTAPPLAVQTVVYADRSLSAALAELAETAIDRVELWNGHLAPDDGENTVIAAEGTIADHGVAVGGYGVVDVDDPATAHDAAALAARLGADYLTVNFPPGRDDITEALLAAADEHDLAIAVHNYSDVHHDDLDAVFASVDDVAALLERHKDPRLGACVDTGHFLHMDESPAAALDRLAGRVHAVHLKDTSAAEAEDLPGAGRLDLDTVAGLLADHDMLDVPLVIEYELDPDRATEALREAVANVTAALDRKA